MAVMNLQGEGEEPPERRIRDLWSTSRVHSIYDLHSEDRDRRIWAHGNLIELYLLSPCIRADADPPGTRLMDADEARRHALEHAEALVSIAGRESFEVYSTRRQIFRYIQWYNEISDLAPETTKLANEVFKRFPPEVEERWR
jgi:hypothetical protein